MFWCRNHTTCIHGTNCESVGNNGPDETDLTVSQNMDDTFGSGSDDDSEEMDSDDEGSLDSEDPFGSKWSVSR